MDIDNIAALLCSIYYGYTQEQAFNHVEHKKVRKWYTDEDIEDMRKLHEYLPLWQVARIYNMDKSTVSKLIRGVPFNKGGSDVKGTPRGKSLNRDHLKKAKKDKGLTLIQIADKIGYAPETVQEWQYKRKRVSDEGIELLAKLLEVDKEYLIQN